METRLNRNTLIKCALALTLAHAPLAMAQALWGGTKGGMSPAEVQAVRPAAVSVDASKVGPIKGDQGLLREAPIDVAGMAFAATMYFRDGKLTQVSLNNVDGAPIPDGLDAYNRLVEALVSKYGKPIKSSRSSDLGTSGSDTWISNDLTITSVIFQFGAQPTINVNYSHRAAENAKNL